MFIMFTPLCEPHNHSRIRDSCVQIYFVNFKKPIKLYKTGPVSCTREIQLKSCRARTMSQSREKDTIRIRLDGYFIGLVGGTLLCKVLLTVNTAYASRRDGLLFGSPHIHSAQHKAHSTQHHTTMVYRRRALYSYGKCV